VKVGGRAVGTGPIERIRCGPTRVQTLAARAGTHERGCVHPHRSLAHAPRRTAHRPGQARATSTPEASDPGGVRPPTFPESLANSRNGRNLSRALSNLSLTPPLAR